MTDPVVSLIDVLESVQKVFPVLVSLEHRLGFVDGLQKATLPPPAIQATWRWLFAMAGLAPASMCGPSLGTPSRKTCITI